jgi:hypothetical protein
MVTTKVIGELQEKKIEQSVSTILLAPLVHPFLIDMHRRRREGTKNTCSVSLRQYEVLLSSLLLGLFYCVK